MNLPMNLRALEPDEAQEFMHRLARLCNEFGVEIAVVNRNIGYERFGELDIMDYAGNTLFGGVEEFDDSEILKILKENDEHPRN